MLKNLCGQALCRLAFLRLIFLIVPAFIFGACGSKSSENTVDSNVEASIAEVSQEEEDDVEGDADEWSYKVVLKKPEVRPGEEYLSDGLPKFVGLTLVLPNGQYLEFNDDVDYGNFIRQFAYGIRLCREVENASVGDWNKFTKDVLNGTRYVVYTASSFENVSSEEWKEKARKIWYDYYKELPIIQGDHKYGTQEFAYPLYRGDQGYSGRIYVTRTESDNPYNLPAGAILIKSF